MAFSTRQKCENLLKPQNSPALSSQQQLLQLLPSPHYPRNYTVHLHCTMSTIHKLLFLSLFITVRAGVIQQWYRIGGNGGGAFVHYQIRQKAVVTRIEAWAGSWTLRGVKIHYSNGVTRLFGKAADRYSSMNIDYAAGEHVTELSIWGNGAGSRCGAFRIKTNKGQHFFPKMYRWGLKREYKMQVGSGIILGVHGKHGSDIDSLGFLMLRKVIGSDLINVRYDFRGGNLNPPQKKFALDVTIPNPSDTDSDKGFHKVTKQRQTGGSWSVTTGVTFGQSYEVEAGVPQVASTKVTSSWQLSVSGTYGRTWSTTHGMEISVPLIVPARERTRITVDYYEGRINKLPYTANMKYFLDNHSKFYTNVRGVYNGYSTSRFVMKSEVVAVWNDAARRWETVRQGDLRYRRTVRTLTA